MPELPKELLGALNYDELKKQHDAKAELVKEAERQLAKMQQAMANYQVKLGDLVNETLGFMFQKADHVIRDKTGRPGHIQFGFNTQTGNLEISFEGTEDEQLREEKWRFGEFAKKHVSPDQITEGTRQNGSFISFPLTDQNVHAANEIIAPYLQKAKQAESIADRFKGAQRPAGWNAEGNYREPTWEERAKPQLADATKFVRE